MTGLDAIIQQLNAQLESTFCAEAETQFCGLVDLVTKDGTTFPMDPVDGEGKPIIPDGNRPIRVFWYLPSDVTYEDREGYGDGKQYILNAPVKLYVVGLMSVLDGECFSTTRSLITELADALPRKPFALSSTIESVQLRSLSINFDRADVLSTVYTGLDTGNKVLDMIAGAIEFDVVANICETLCGDIISLCDDATVKNTAGTTIGTVESGGTLIVGDSNVSNSNDSYSVDVPATTDLELADNNISNSDDSYSVNQPAQEDHELPDITVTVQDQDSNVLGTFPNLPSAVNQTVQVTIASLTGTALFGFGIGNQNKLFYRNRVKFTMQSINLSNVATYEIWQNGVSIGTHASPPPAGTIINWGDKIYIEITRTAGGLNSQSASIELVPDDMKYGFTVTSESFFFARDYATNVGLTDANDEIIKNPNVPIRVLKEME